MGLDKILRGLENGAKSSIPVVAACAASGIIIGVVTLTGIGIVFSRAVITMAGGNLPLMLFLVMIASLVLGMGVPTIASYVILVVVAAPALIKMGVLPIAAHMFVFYFGVISNITPPVALAAYAAAGIAGSNLWKTGLIAVRLSSVGFIAPFMFIYAPTLLAIGSFSEVTWSFVTSIIGVFALAVAISGFFIRRAHPVIRMIAFAASLFLIAQGAVSDMIGFVLIGLVCAWQKFGKPTAAPVEKVI